MRPIIPRSPTPRQRFRLLVAPRFPVCTQTVLGKSSEHGGHRVGTEIREKKQKRVFSVPLRAFSLISVSFSAVTNLVLQLAKPAEGGILPRQVAGGEQEEEEGGADEN
jgi:hypothetical protein